jgi:hypothetical protein
VQFWYQGRSLITFDTLGIVAILTPVTPGSMSLVREKGKREETERERLEFRGRAPVK